MTTYGPFIKTPRPVEAFEVPEEDFLAEAPRALSASELFKLEIEPPAWAVQAISKRGGQRHPKRERQYVPSNYGLSVYPPQSLPGNLGALGPFSKEQHDADEIERAYQEYKARDRRRDKQARRGRKGHQEPSPKKLVAKGNLRNNEDYRYWKGYAIEHSDRDLALCRWCDKMCKGRGAMEEHHEKEFCRERLQALYRYAKLSHRHQLYCMACKRETREQYWGLPLCNRLSCLTRWKFGFSDSLQGLCQYREWAQAAQDSDPHQGPYCNLPPEEDYSDTSGRGPAC